MAKLAYLTLTGQRSGTIKGSITQPGREGTIGVLAVSHEIDDPADPQSGLPTGRRVHKPLHITKEIDAATPLLLQVLCTNENLKSFRLDFYAININGQEKPAYRVDLVNANILSYELAPPEGKDGQDKSLGHEQFAFTYEQITWTWIDSGKTASDSWVVRS